MAGNLNWTRSRYHADPGTAVRIRWRHKPPPFTGPRQDPHPTARQRLRKAQDISQSHRKRPITLPKLPASWMEKPEDRGI